MIECTSMVSYSIMVNEELKRLINWLGDFDKKSQLFIIGVKCLNALINQIAIIGNICGISISKGGPKITHLFLPNDNLLFWKSTLKDSQKIQEILSKYE